METLAERVKEALNLSGKNQTDLARACGITPTSVNNWLSGETQSLKSKSAIAAAKFLNVRVEWLTENRGVMQESGAQLPADQTIDTPPALAVTTDPTIDYLNKMPPHLAARLRLDIKHEYERWQLEQESEQHKHHRQDDPPQHSPNRQRSG